MSAPSTGGPVAARPGKSLALDRTDAAWAGLEFSYLWFGLDVPPVEELRRALVMVMEAAPLLGSRVDLQRGRYTPARAADRAARACELVVEGFPDDWTPQTGLWRVDRYLGTDPFRLEASRQGLAVRWSHALGDAWSCFTLIKHLLEQARTTERLPLTWDHLTARHRDLLAARSVLQRPGTVLRAVRHRDQFSGGRFELASLHTGQEEHHAVVARSDADFLPALAKERARRGVRTTTGSIVLTGMRKHLAHRLVEPLPGAEVLYDVRSLSPRSRRAFGNWAAGVYVRPEDDSDVESVNTAAKEIRDRGYPFLAAAAARRRARLQGRGDRMVLAPQGRPRLTLTYLNRGGPQNGFPWRPDLEHELVSEGPPNGLETITIGGREWEARLDLSICHYPAAWPIETMTQVVADFLADPWGDSLPGVGR